VAAGVSTRHDVVLLDLARRLTGDRPGDEALDAARKHLFDALVAARIGALVEDARPVAALAPEASRPGGPDLGAALRTAFRIRCTEIDDIHPESCTTPGSVAVPAVLALAPAAAARPGVELLEALVAGYEATARLGLAVDGAQAVYRGHWPTYVAAGVGAAAAAGRLLRLPAEELAHAMALALLLATGTTGGSPGGRWFSLACAVQHGVRAAMAAGAGVRGSLELPERRWTQLTGIPLAVERLTEARPAPEIERTSFKPYCAARQVTAAVHALQRALAAGAVRPEAIGGIEVGVPSCYARMIDRPEIRGRLDSLVSAQYQLALAVLDPGGLSDVRRRVLRADPGFRALMDGVRIHPDPELDGLYPALWPARVRVLAGGERRSAEVRQVPGDPPAPGWEWLTAKALRVLRGVVEEPEVHALAARCRGLDTIGQLLAGLATGSAGSWVS
jgi:2-methylcitrate dehydratase PrpD